MPASSPDIAHRRQVYSSPLPTSCRSQVERTEPSGPNVRLLLVQRRNFKRELLDLENAIRRSLKVFGIRLGKIGRGSMENAVRDAVAGDPMTAVLLECVLRARAALREEYLIPRKQVTQLALATSCPAGL